MTEEHGGRSRKGFADGVLGWERFGRLRSEPIDCLEAVPGIFDTLQRVARFCVLCDWLPGICHTEPFHFTVKFCRVLHGGLRDPKPLSDFTLPQAFTAKLHHISSIDTSLRW